MENNKSKSIERIIALRAGTIKKAFTLIEAVIVMMVVGVMAAVSMTVFKPHQYQKKALSVNKGKVYVDIAGVTNEILSDCTVNLSLNKIRDNCDKTAATHAFGDGAGVKDAKIYANYMRGTYANAANTTNGSCQAMNGYTSLRLKNGVCIYFGANFIKADVNSSKGPNKIGQDQMVLTIGNKEGITTDLNDVTASNEGSCSRGVMINGSCMSCNSLGFGYGCNSCTEAECTRCSSTFILINGECIPCNEILGFNGCAKCDGGICTECNRGLMIDGVCKSCSSLGFSNCKNCTNSECITCDPEHTMVNGVCKSCTEIVGFEGCGTCNNGTCTGCYYEYTMVNGVCKSCTEIVGFEGCKNCDNGTCTGCHTRYTMVNGICQSCESLYGAGCIRCSRTACQGCSGKYNMVNGHCVLK